MSGPVGEKFQHAGLFYIKHRLNEQTNVQSWRCTKRGCHGRIWTTNGQFLEVRNVHTCAAAEALANIARIAELEAEVARLREENERLRAGAGQQQAPETAMGGGGMSAPPPVGGQPPYQAPLQQQHDAGLVVAPRGTPPMGAPFNAAPGAQQQPPMAQFNVFAPPPISQAQDGYAMQPPMSAGMGSIAPPPVMSTTLGGGSAMGGEGMPAPPPVGGQPPYYVQQPGMNMKPPPIGGSPMGGGVPPQQQMGGQQQPPQHYGMAPPPQQDGSAFYGGAGGGHHQPPFGAGLVVAPHGTPPMGTPHNAALGAQQPIGGQQRQQHSRMRCRPSRRFLARRRSEA